MRDLILLKSVASILDVVAINLEKREAVRNERLDLIRCAIEDFREDLEQEKVSCGI